MTTRTRPLVAAVLVAVVAITAGCGAVNLIPKSEYTTANASAGKTLFVEKCGSCHTLGQAQTSGAVGPNLDDAFAADKSPSFHTHAEALSSIANLVRGQIAYPDSEPGTGSPGMTPNLLHGQQARDVAIYVAMCSADPSCGINASSPAVADAVES